MSPFTKVLVFPRNIRPDQALVGYRGTIWSRKVQIVSGNGRETRTIFVPCGGDRVGDDVILSCREQ